ncbi:MAG: hypothetical protein RIS75_52 [Actinomycetota bacterium]|jgi:hypothetical protein
MFHKESTASTAEITRTILGELATIARHPARIKTHIIPAEEKLESKYSAGVIPTEVIAKNGCDEEYAKTATGTTYAASIFDLDSLKIIP